MNDQRADPAQAEFNRTWDRQRRAEIKATQPLTLESLIARIEAADRWFSMDRKYVDGRNKTGERWSWRVEIGTPAGPIVADNPSLIGSLTAAAKEAGIL